MGTRYTGVVGRRWFLAQTGRGIVGIAVLGLGACTAASERPAGNPSPAPAEPPQPAAPTAAPENAEPGPGLTWSRVDLGFVSAYVLVRGREAAVVDTGVGGSADAIGAVLDEAGPGWTGVRHVVLTHKHPDHAGSIGDVLTEAPRATGYVGAADLPDVDAPRRLTTLGDGDEVFGLQIIGTPGHTAGHLAVFDADTGVLVAGDALNNDGALSGANPQFTEDVTEAAASVRKMARLAPTTILVGHGAPVLDGAAAALDELASSLG